MPKQKIILTIIILILTTVSIFSGFNYFLARKKLQIVEQQLKVQQNNIEVVNFTKLFIDKVLKAEKEVSFEDRLKLENSVRDLDDDEILALWTKFTASKTEAEAQNAVKNLLELLVKKFYY